MPTQRGNPRLIKLYAGHSVEEAARTLGVHKNSVRGWRSNGLKPIDGGRVSRDNLADPYSGTRRANKQATAQGAVIPRVAERGEAAP